MSWIVPIHVWIWPELMKFWIHDSWRFVFQLTCTILELLWMMMDCFKFFLVCYWTCTWLNRRNCNNYLTFYPTFVTNVFQLKLIAEIKSSLFFNSTLLHKEKEKFNRYMQVFFCLSVSCTQNVMIGKYFCILDS